MKHGVGEFSGEGISALSNQQAISALKEILLSLNKYKFTSRIFISNPQYEVSFLLRKSIIAVEFPSITFILLVHGIQSQPHGFMAKDKED